MIITIDGYSSCGKSTFAKNIARELKILYVDSGAMYRGVTLFCIENEFIGKDFFKKDLLIKNLSSIQLSFSFSQNDGTSQRLMLNGKDVEEQIRSMKVSSHVSEVSTIREVRERMVQLQRNYGKNQSIVMDGRDIGTVVFPGAELKIFMTAELNVRAFRRHKELLEKGIKLDFEEVKLNLAERDRIDSSREFSPLSKAKDAILLDNSEMTMEDQMKWFRNIISTIK